MSQTREVTMQAKVASVVLISAVVLLWLGFGFGQAFGMYTGGDDDGCPAWVSSLVALSWGMVFLSLLALVTGFLLSLRERLGLFPYRGFGYAVLISVADWTVNSFFYNPDDGPIASHAQWIWFAVTSFCTVAAFAFLLYRAAVGRVPTVRELLHSRKHWQLAQKELDSDQ